MLRRSCTSFLKARPKDALTEVGCKRRLPEKWLKMSEEMFATRVFPYKRVLHNHRYFMKPGKAATGPPVGQDFSALGLKAMDFAKAFNDKTKGKFKEDVELPVHVQFYYDKTYTWHISPPPEAWFLLRCVRKKRRETGPLDNKGRYTAYVTLEMIYEIAISRGVFNKRNRVTASEYGPSLEENAGHIANMAKKMGLAIIGVDAPNSPVKGMTTAQYDKQAAEYRKVQWELSQAYKQEGLLKEGSLHDKFHKPHLENAPRHVVEKIMADPQMGAKLWHQSRPRSWAVVEDAEKGRIADFVGAFNEDVIRDMSRDELKALLFNWKMPAVERVRQEKGMDAPYQTYWDSNKRDITL